MLKKSKSLNKYKNRFGFTLVELMIVVVIIGILASLAIPRFMRATTKAKQSEAKGILKQIYTLQMAYRVDHDQYFITAASADSANPNTFADLGLGVEVMVVAKYIYTITSTDAGLSNFTATANATGLDDDATPDTWTINQTGAIAVTSDDALN